MGSGAFAPGSARRSYVIEGVTFDHFAFDGASAPNDDEEDRTYATLNRIRGWDANVRNGWMPVGHGRKRMIEGIE
jgi:hypothetical protein